MPEQPSTGLEVFLSEVRKTYAAGGATITAVDSVSLDIAAGTMTSVTGPSGSGKSSLLQLIGALDRPDSGTIRVGDLEITALTGRQLTRFRRTIGFVFQRYHLLPTLTALDNVLAPLIPYRTAFDPVARGRELLAAVGLADRERSLPGQLSGGQQQRIAIARALINRPALLLADEPTGNLDSANGQEILDLLDELRAAFPMTVLIATHEQQVVDRCDRMLRLRDGRLVEDRDARGPAVKHRLDEVGGLPM
jgi:putative ABC transport system ATP-binding protein